MIQRDSQALYMTVESLADQGEGQKSDAAVLDRSN